MKRICSLAIVLMIAWTSGVAAQQSPTIQGMAQPVVHQQTVEQPVVEQPVVAQTGGQQVAVAQQPTVAQPYYSGCDAPVASGCDSSCGNACGSGCDSNCGTSCGSACGSSCGSSCGGGCGSSCGNACGGGSSLGLVSRCGSGCGSGCGTIGCGGCAGGGGGNCCGTGNNNVYQSCGIDNACGCGNAGCRGGGACGRGSCLGGGDPLRCGVTLLFGFEGWANRADDNDANNFGSRLGFNFGRDISGQLGMQFGMNWGAYNWAGREDDNTRGEENHVYTTLGIYRRSNMDCCDRLSFGMVWDYLLARNYSEDGNDHLDLNQVRLLVGYALDSRNEVGFWTAYGANGETIVDGDPVNPGGIVPIRIVDQYNTYWRANWRSGGETMLFAGIPARGNDVGDFIVGLNMNAPLNQRTEVVANWHYIHDSGTGNSFGTGGQFKEFAQPSWDVFVGIQFYPGDNAARRNISGNRHVPLLPVASYGTMTYQPPPTADF
ncbi:MAG: DUF6666 family protein [Pirellulaceae bacterium]